MAFARSEKLCLMRRLAVRNRASQQAHRFVVVRSRALLNFIDVGDGCIQTAAQQLDGFLLGFCCGKCCQQ